MNFADILQGTKDRVEADAWFADLPVIIDVAGDLENQLEQALARLGLACVIAVRSSRNIQTDSSRPNLQCELGVMLTEIPTTNNTGKHALEGLDRIIPLLHAETIGDPLLGPELRYQNHDREDAPGTATYVATFTVQFPPS